MRLLGTSRVVGLAALLVCAILVILLATKPAIRPKEGFVSLARTNLSIPDFVGEANLTILLTDKEGKPIRRASGWIAIEGGKLDLEERDGAYVAVLRNIAAGVHVATIHLEKKGYKIQDASTNIFVVFNKTYPALRYLLNLSELSFSTDRPEICRPSFLEDGGLNVTVLRNESRVPLLQFELAFAEPLNLSTFHYAELQIRAPMCPELSVGLVDEEGGSVWVKAELESDHIQKWDFNNLLEKTSRRSWGGLWGGLKPRNLVSSMVDFDHIGKLVFRTLQRRDGKNYSIELRAIAFVREKVSVHVCPPLLAQAINRTLLERADPMFIHQETGIPFEYINLVDRSVPSSSDLDFTLGNNEIGEGLESFWMYYFGSREPWVGGFLRRVAQAIPRYLDPGDGLIGLHHYDRRTGRLEPDTHRLAGCTFKGGPAGESSAQHGGEEAMYMMLPAAWYFKDEEAVSVLERFSRTLLKLNSDPRLIHLHLYVKRCDGVWSVGDWNGEYGDGMQIVPPSPDAYTDLSEFWWVTPMMGCAFLTQNQTLRQQIVSRCSRIVENVLAHQAPDGRIPYVFRMDGTEARFNATALGWHGYLLNSFFARSVYLLHNMTGEERYLRSLEKMYNWFLDGHIPSSPTFGSQVIFHSFYTRNSSFAERLIRFIRAKFDLKRMQGDIYACIWRLFPYVWNGSLEDLRLALQAEARFRAHNWVPIPYNSNHFYYFPLHQAETIIRWGWCPLDKFGSGVEQFYALLSLGPRSKGLVGRDLLILGMLSGIGQEEPGENSWAKVA